MMIKEFAVVQLLDGWVCENNHKPAIKVDISE